MTVRRLTALLAALFCLLAPSAASADFGFAPEGTFFEFENRDGSVITQAGAHPYLFNLNYEMNKIPGGIGTDGGAVRDLVVDLPPGLVGNPLATPRCKVADFGSEICDGTTQIGRLNAVLPGVGEAVGPLYNLVPPPGVVAQIGFSSLDSLKLLGSASVVPDDGYLARVASPNLPTEANPVRLEIWGTPADPGHDDDRVCKTPDGSEIAGCSSGAAKLPFITIPTSCEQAPVLTLHADSKLNPGAYVDISVPLRDAAGDLQPLTGCASVPFSPSVDSLPTTESADSPAGLGFGLSLPNAGLLSVNDGAISETEPRKTVVKLPAGITANPAAANGLGACAPAEYQASSCPQSAKLGTLTAHSPLLEEAIEGSVYLAAPHDNPFGSLLALYILAEAPERGVTVKQAGRIDVDPQTGQLTTTIEGLPPLPYSDFEVRLREGPRAPLITPQGCGTYTTTAELFPFSAPENPKVRTAPFTISSGAGGGACGDGEADLPNTPSLSAGAVAPVAAADSPFVLRLSRSDGTQRFSALEASPPAGLVAKLAGVPYCPEAGIAQAAARTAEGDGAAEIATPSCPSASQVGTVLAGAGAGSSPYYAPGKAYLAGPYKGAPLSIEVITPAIAGPLDLGVVAVRAPVFVNPETAKISVESDPLPTILHGIPLAVRSVSVLMDRAEFTRNPTNCEPTTVDASLTSLIGSVAPLSQRFQVGGCRGLAFEPRLAVSLKGPTRRTGHPALKAVVTFPRKGRGANIAATQVSLPPAEFLDQANLDRVCTQPELRSRTCPASSVYGRAKAWSPLLDEPLEGPVYLGVGYGHQLPDIVADLDGQIRILVHGRVDTTKKHGLRNTFEVVPDAPVSRFVLEMKGGGRYGLLVNSENVCARPQRATARFVGQNGSVATLHPKVDNGCGRGKGKKGRKGQAR